MTIPDRSLGPSSAGIDLAEQITNVGGVRHEGNQARERPEIYVRSTARLARRLLHSIGFGLAGLSPTILCAWAGAVSHPSWFGLMVAALFPAPLFIIAIQQGAGGLWARWRRHKLVLWLDGDNIAGVHFDGRIATIRLSALDYIWYSIRRNGTGSCMFHAAKVSLGFDLEDIDAEPKALLQQIASMADLEPAPKQIRGFGKYQAAVYAWGNEEWVAVIEAGQAERRAKRERRKARKAQKHVAGDVGK